MNNLEAKFILQGYRPNGADAGDAAFGAALEQARHDPGLGEWFAREQAFDRMVSAKLAEVQPPAGLREAILAGARVTAPDTVRHSWWRQPVWMAAAAAVAVIFSVGLALWPNQATAGGALSDFAFGDAQHSSTHGGHGAETGALQAMLSQPGTRLGRGLPVDFATLRTAGCRTLSFQGHDVLEVCFQRDGAWFHCYIAQSRDFPSLARVVAPVLADRNGTSVASWADATHLYVVVSKTGRAALERLL